MIKTLSIKNYAIIDEIEIEFVPNLTIITGETGAGKSILLGALGLIMGKRAEPKVLHDKSKKCIVEGVFDISSYQLSQFFIDHDLDNEKETVLRREISPSGKSRAFINDTPVTLSILKLLSHALIDLHQQFDTLDINTQTYQIQILDAVAENKSQLAKYQKVYKEWKSEQELLLERTKFASNAKKEFDFIQFQVNELESANLEAGELSVLESSLKKMNNSAAIQQALDLAAGHLIDGEHAITDRLKSIELEVEKVAIYDPTIETLSKRLHSLSLDAEDIGMQFSQLLDGTNSSEEDIKLANDRLDIIYRLQKKHNQPTDEGLILFRDELVEKLKTYERIDEELVSLTEKVEALEQKMEVAAQNLSRRRKTVVNNLEKSVQKKLAELAMEHARLKVEITESGHFHENGKDQIRFLFAANKGSSFEPIKQVASGGEMARLAFCIESLVAKLIPLPSLIFDEIDTGISGAVALKMGNMMRQLAQEHQVIVITHSPQIAIQAEKHYFVYKKIEGSQTFTRLKELNQAERIEEIATMLSGSPPTSQAIENAKSLLEAH